jgi:serine protease Do
MAVTLENPMDTVVNVGPWAGRVSEELATLASRISASVVIVRNGHAGAGSGVVWNAHGLVVTNAHVATGGYAEVELPNGDKLKAQVVARSRQLDLAALQIAGPLPEGLVPAEIGDSAHLNVGELVLAVGNPNGERNVVTLGMVGGSGPAPWDEQRRDVIRVAITLRPGNSGGALADTRGRVVGIPHMVVGPGLALAVPSRAVRQFLNGELAA